MPLDLTHIDAHPHPWSVTPLTAPPLIAPARQYTYPLQIPGEEDALARGALQLLIRPANGTPQFLATCALGFRDPSMPTALLSSPNPKEICAVAGGYAYLIDTGDPTRSTHIPLKPVTAVLPTSSLLLFAGFHTLLAWGADGIAWQTPRLSWEGIQLGEITPTTLHGTGWNLLTDRDVPFTVDLATGRHSGGAFPQPASETIPR